MKNSIKIRPLAEIINDLASRMRLIASRRPYSRRSQVDLTQALHAAGIRGEAMADHWRSLDRLARELICNQYHADAAVVAGCALELIRSVRAVALDDASLLSLRCHLLAKLAHAASRCGKFNESMDADRQLGLELMAVLRSDADFPVKQGGIAALVDYLVTETCAPPLPALLRFVGRPEVETV
ncbi:MAG: hypothetical protein K2X77_30825 [Candidatus Obscuribacterales bacterium]|jgi:hypothetical protein|nr:hypothetical protein [Candidatus Obscuribacterales bacterium]